MAVTRSDFAKLLIDARTKRGMSQADLMKALGVHQQALSRWELGISLPRDPQLHDLMNFFGTDSGFGAACAELIKDREIRRYARAKGLPLDSIDPELNPSEFVKRYAPAKKKSGPFHKILRELGGDLIDMERVFKSERQRLIRRLELELFDPEVTPASEARLVALRAVESYDAACRTLAEALALLDVVSTPKRDLVPERL